MSVPHGYTLSIIASFVDPVWRDVMNLVCKEWNTYRTLRVKTQGRVELVRGTPNAFVLNNASAWYVRSSKDTRVFGRGVKRIATDRNGDSTYTRDSNLYPMKYCRIHKGILGKIRTTE